MHSYHEDFDGLFIREREGRCIALNKLAKSGVPLCYQSALESESELVHALEVERIGYGKCYLPQHQYHLFRSVYLDSLLYTNYGGAITANEPERVGLTQPARRSVSSGQPPLLTIEKIRANHCNPSFQPCKSRQMPWKSAPTKKNRGEFHFSSFMHPFFGGIIFIN